MNLVFNFHDQLFWIHNFLPQNLYKEMYVDFIKSRNTLNYTDTNVIWLTFKEEENNMSKSFGGEQDSDKVKDYLNKYHTFLKHQKFVDFMNKGLRSHLRKYYYGQHLGWHHDNAQNRRYAATFYFNRTWRESWGGEFLFKSDKGSGFIPIVGNSILIVKADLKHKVCANLKKTHPRLSIQTWVYDK